MDALLITNAKIVNEGQVKEGDVLVLDGRIAKIAPEICAQGVKQVIDAAGFYLIPGMIDSNVRFREPGLEYKGTMLTESRAAVAGGVTSIMDMPDTWPPTLDQASLNAKSALASQHSLTNYSFYVGAGKHNLEAIKKIDNASYCGIKISMGDASADLLMDDPSGLEKVFEQAPRLIAAHCEDLPIIRENEESYRQIYGDDIPFNLHPQIRNDDACFTASSLAVLLAKKYDTDLHLLNISTEKELALLSDADIATKKITAGTASYFLSFCDDDYFEQAGLISTAPAIKSAEDRAALIQGLMDGRLDMLASDHTPNTYKEKQQKYFNAPLGMPNIQYALQSMLENYHDDIFTLALIVEKTSHAVADRFRLKNRGYIREGYWADLVLLDLDANVAVDNEEVLSLCGWTPYHGMTFRSSIYATIINGNVVWRNGLLRDINAGMPLKFDA